MSFLHKYFVGSKLSTDFEAMLNVLAIIKIANTKTHQIDDNIGLEKSTARQIKKKTFFLKNISRE